MNDVPRRNGCVAQKDRDTFYIVGGHNGATRDKVFIERNVDDRIWNDLAKPTVAREGTVCVHANGEY